MKRNEFEQLISKAVKKIPYHFSEKMKNVAIVVQDVPSPYQMKKIGYSTNTILLGLYEGIPQTQRINYNKASPDKITLFQKNIEKICQNDRNKIKKIVEETIWHEVAHHFGLNEEEVHLRLQKQKAFSKKTMIDINQFKQIDLRIAKIIKAERIKDTTKLILLQIIVGEETRQLVAGIAENYAPENLIGKEIVIVANLEPKKIKGYISQGMLLAAKNENGPVLLVPDGEVESGTPIS